MSEKRNVLILGAAGRDFHNFNTYFRDGPWADKYVVKAFTAEQIPGIDDKMYPPELAGPMYPNGIPIRPLAEMEKIIKDDNIDDVVLAYSDLPYEYVMRQSARANAAGANFILMGPKRHYDQSSQASSIYLCSTYRLWKISDHS